VPPGSPGTALALGLGLGLGTAIAVRSPGWEALEVGRGAGNVQRWVVRYDEGLLEAVFGAAIAPSAAGGQGSGSATPAATAGTDMGWLRSRMVGAEQQDGSVQTRVAGAGGLAAVLARLMAGGSSLGQSAGAETEAETNEAEAVEAGRFVALLGCSAAGLGSRPWRALAAALVTLGSGAAGGVALRLARAARTCLAPQSDTSASRPGWSSVVAAASSTAGLQQIVPMAARDAMSTLAKGS